MVQEFPIYDVVLEDDTLGLTAISLVDYPAIQENWISFSKEQMIFLGERRQIIAPLLIPNQLILRKAEDGSLYYIRWKRDTILQAAERYIENGFFNNFTYMHAYFYSKDMKYEDSFEKDINMLRLWTIEDKDDDAYTKYHFDNLPLGTLMCHFKVGNDALWQKIKNKEVMGCSIEASVKMEKNEDNNFKINQNKMDINAKQMNLMQKFIAFLNEVASEAESIADVAKKDETNSGEVTLKYYTDDEHFIQVDAEGYARDEEYNLVAQGEYKLADGNVLIVDENNKFVETKAPNEVEKTEVEVPIAESKLKDEKDDENKGEDNTDISKDNPEGGVEDVPVDDNEPSEDGAKEDEAKEDEAPIEEAPTEEEPIDVVPFEIDGVEYMLPQAVIDYINGLKGEKENADAEIAMMKQHIPSATPIPTVINQSNEKNDNEGMDLFSAIKLLNKK